MLGACGESGGEVGAGGSPWGDGGGAWLRLGILVTLGGMWIESTVFSYYCCGVKKPAEWGKVTVPKFKSHLREYSEVEGSFGGSFGLNIGLTIFPGLVSPKKGVFRINNLIPIICTIILVIL
jgi:hypothetical protein